MQAIDLSSQMNRVAHEAAATVLGQRGILRTLKGEHAEMLTLLRGCERTHDNPRGVTKRRTIFEKIRSQLVSHLETEEQELYAALAMIPEARGRIERDRRQHEAIETLVERLSLLDAATTPWMEACHELYKACSQHVEEEEDELFPLALRHLNAQDLEDMDRRYRRERQHRMTNLERELH